MYCKQYCSCAKKPRLSDLTRKPSRKYCTWAILILSIIITIYLIFFWIKWDATVAFSSPSLSDVSLPMSIHIKDLNNTEWIEKRGYMIEVASDKCSSGEYDFITNKNLKILGMNIRESFVYICDNSRMYTNLVISEIESSNVKLNCNESYAGHWRIRQRYHPVNVKWYNMDGIFETEISLTYKDTCILSQAYDLLKSKWVPDSI